MARVALGFIETRGYTGNALSIDAMLKAASVDFVKQVAIGGAYVTAVVRGEVGAVHSSVEAGAEAAGRVGELVCANTIASAHERVFGLIGIKASKPETTGSEALGVIETLGFATAMQSADAAIKAASVGLTDWLKVGGGKVNVIMRGDVAAVKAAVEAGVNEASKIGNVQAHTVIPRASEKLVKFPIHLSAVSQNAVQKSALQSVGILETRGFAPLIEGADAAVKAAKVDVVEWRQVGSGYVSFVVEGEVAAVRSAIDAANQAASRIGEVISEVVIPRPVDEMDATFGRK